jgi:hypothetical protein
MALSGSSFYAASSGTFLDEVKKESGGLCNDLSFLQFARLSKISKTLFTVADPRTNRNVYFYITNCERYSNN